MARKMNSLTKNQLGALISLMVVAAWALWVLWLHVTSPIGIEHTEILFLSAMAPVYLILLPFYWRRVRWSYISGIIVLLGLFLEALKSVFDNTIFFSFSAYNLTTVVVFLVALACMYFSLWSYLELPSGSKLKSSLGIGLLVAISVLAVWQVSANQARIENYILEKVIHGVQSRTGDIEVLDNKINALMAVGDIPSMAAAIVINDEIVWQRGFGEGADVDKLFDIGSITKSVVATAVLQLYERELIDLDDDVNDYLPFKIRHPDYPDVPITIRLLLSNRSCLGHNTGTYYAYTMGPALRQWGVEKRGWDERRDLSILLYPDFMSGYLDPEGPYYQSENWSDCLPGTKFTYSTPGFDLLGFLVEQVSGQQISEYLQQNIFNPLKMASTTLTPLDTPERVAIPYERWYGVLAKTNVVLPLAQRRMVGGGGLYSNVADLSNFLLMHMNHGKFGEYQVLQHETVALMHQMASDTTDDFMQVGYGYGWGRFQDTPKQMWDITFHPRGMQGHGGRTWGYNGMMIMVEEREGSYGYVLLMNHSMVESMDLPWVFSVQFNIQDLILGEAYRMYQAALSQ